MEIDREGRAIRTLNVWSLAAIALIHPSTAFASPASINLPAGSVGQAVNAIGRQANVSIVVADRIALSRRVPAIRGRMEPSEALARVARAADLNLQQVGTKAFVLTVPRTARTRRIPIAPTRPRQLPPAIAPEQLQSAPPIVVTASKRDTPANRFAGQWHRIGGRELSTLGVVGSEAIEVRSVGFSSTHLGAGRNKLFIRGIADSSFSGPTQSPVGQYFGDMRTTYSGPDPDLKLVDMQSIEVLEGPQGTLYGSGALGGIVLLKPEAPRFSQLGGTLIAGTTATWHGATGYDLAGVINAPIADTAALRVTAYQSREPGYVDNVATGEKDINDVDVRGARATFSAELRPDWFVDLSGLSQDIDGADSQYADRGGTGLTRSSLVNQPFSSDFKLASLVLRKDTGSLRFRSTSGASWQDVHETFDASTETGTRRLLQRSRAQALSNETRIWRPMSGGYSWLLGVSSIAHRYRIDRDIETSGVVTDLAGTENEVREVTAYGEASVELTPRAELSLGARYTHSTISGSGEHLNPAVANKLTGNDRSRTERPLLPSLALLFRPSSMLALFARYQHGFRPGGLSIAGDTVRLYRNDRLATAEVGFRFGQQGRDQFDLKGGITYSRWNDIQADFLDSSGLPVTDNIGDGRVWTLNLNGGAQLLEGWRLEGGFAWNDGRITSPSGTFRTLVDGAAVPAHAIEIPNIARIVARGGLTWRADLGSDWAIEANGYARYVGRSRLGIGPRLGEKQGSYLDSGLIVKLMRDRRAISVSLTNIFDEVGNRFAFGAPLANGADQITPLRPRAFRLGIEQAF